MKKEELRFMDNGVGALNELVKFANEVKGSYLVKFYDSRLYVNR